MNRFIYFLCILLFASCNRFLEVELNKSQITTEKVFNSDVTATAAVTNIYNGLSNAGALSGLPKSMSSLAELSSNELSNYGQEPDLQAFEQHQIISQNPHIEVLWNFMYNLIYQANAIIEGVHSSAALSKGVRSQLEGEALFMRAFTYFYLVNLFGEVPLAVTTNYNQNKSISRQPVDQVYTLIESDLLSAQSLLSTQYVTVNRARPNKATAIALLARVYLYQQKDTEAEAQASAIITDSAYRLTRKEDINKTFLVGSEETIWQVMPGSPSANTMEGYYFIITSIPHYHVMTDTLLHHFEPGDLRRANWVGVYTNTIGTFYFPYKYKQKSKDAAASFTEASVVFRLAEMYLIRAEARAKRNNVAGAQADLDTIRTRAGLPGTTASDPEALLLAIESDRWSELFTEYGHRWLDLKRTGKAVAILGNGITVDDLLYPLPAAEFTKNPHLGDQNTGY
jgi:hypothetical protein